MNRGGKRQGAGRKMLSDSPRVSLSIRVSQETKNALADLKRRGISAGQLIDNLVRDYLQIIDY